MPKGFGDFGYKNMGESKKREHEFLDIDNTWKFYTIWRKRGEDFTFTIYDPNGGSHYHLEARGTIKDTAHVHVKIHTIVSDPEKILLPKLETKAKKALKAMGAEVVPLFYKEPESK